MFLVLQQDLLKEIDMTQTVVTLDKNADITLIILIMMYD